MKIIVSLNDNYKDIASIFIKQFKRNWPDCPYQLYLSFNNEAFGNYSIGKVIENKQNKSLTKSIYDIVCTYEDDYYLCLLGDAFIGKKVNNNEVNELITKFKKNNISYCSLMHENFKEKSFTYIKNNEVYAFNFPAFIAKRDYIINEFSELKDDYAFEEKYLKEAFIAENSLYREDMVKLDKPIFGIIHGVVNGKWLRDSYKKMKIYKYNELYDRKQMTIHKYVIYKSRLYLHKVISPRLRHNIKNILTKFGISFYSKY